MNFQAEFELLLRSRYSIIYIQTREEERVENAITELAKKQGNRGVYVWDFVEGYQNNPNDMGWGKRNPLQGLELVEKLPESAPAIFILRDFQRFLEDISISRKLRNLAKKLKSQPKNLVILAPQISVPEDLKNPSDKRDKNSQNSSFTKSVWFELSVGRDDTAEPRWLVAMLCKAGNLSKRDIGSIKIQTKVTYVEISEQTSNSLLKFVNDKKPIERHIMVKLLKNPPKLDRATSQPSQNKRRRSSKLFLKDKDEEGLNKPKNIDFKGKRKSERWKKIEKRTKPSN